MGPSRAIVVAVLSVMFVALTITGFALAMPKLVGALVQSALGILGIVLGYLLQKGSDEARAEGAVRSAVVHLLGLAKSMNSQIQEISLRREQIANGSFRTISEMQSIVDAELRNEENLMRAHLNSVEASVESWRSVGAEVVDQIFADAQDMATNEDESKSLRTGINDAS